MPEKLSDYVVRFLAGLGVKHVFLVPGGGAMHLNDSLGRNNDLQFVGNLHEQASAVAAENYSKMTCNLGVAMVTTGPGATNAITGVAGGWLDSTPMFIVSGQVKRADLKRDTGVRQMGVQEVDIVSMVSCITKYAVTVTDPTTIRFHMEKAAYLAKSGRPGPVWIDIPLDVQASMIEPEKQPGFDAGNQPPAYDKAALVEAVSKTIDQLNAAERPVLLIGNGIKLAGAIPDLLKLADLLGVPMLTTWLAIDLIPNDHPLFFGRPGSIAPRGPNFVAQNSDWLLSLGARMDNVVTAFAPDRFARGAKKIMVDIDPAELNKMKKTIDLLVQADVKAFIDEMLRQKDRIKPRSREPWLARCRDWKTRYPLLLPEHRQPGGRVSLYNLSDVLSDVLSGDDLLVSGSSGSGIELFLLAYKMKAGQRVFHTTALGAMGFGLPAAIGACIAGNRRRTVLVDGDGGIQFNIQELETIRRLNLPVKIFVLNNDGYASIRLSQRTWFEGRTMGADPTCGLTLPDITKVANAYGIASTRIENQTNLRAELERVLAMPGPVVCDVMVVPDETRQPRVSSMQKPDGSMVSKPLEDMWPFLDREEFRANMIVPPLEE